MSSYMGFANRDDYEQACRVWAESLKPSILREFAGEFMRGINREEYRHAYELYAELHPTHRTVQAFQRRQAMPCDRHRNYGYRSRCMDCMLVNPNIHGSREDIEDFMADHARAS